MQTFLRHILKILYCILIQINNICKFPINAFVVAGQ